MESESESESKSESTIVLILIDEKRRFDSLERWRGKYEQRQNLSAVYWSD